MQKDRRLNFDQFSTLETYRYLGSLQITLDYVVQVAEFQRTFSEDDEAMHLRWENLEDAPEYPTLTLGPEISKSPDTMAALVLLMRSSTFYDGSTDFIFEKFMKLIVSLLFGEHRVLFLS